MDVYAMPGHGRRGYVLDVQASLLSHLATRCVVPLIPEAEAPPPIKDLNPVFEITGTRHVMLTQAMATVLRRELGQAVFSLDEYRDEVIRALDILFTGH